MQSAFEPGVANSPDVRLPSDMSPPPERPTISRLLTEEERAHYGAASPFRPELTAALNDGLSIEQVAERFDVAPLDIAQKIVWWWPRIYPRLASELKETASAIHQVAQAFPGVITAPSSASVAYFKRGEDNAGTDDKVDENTGNPDNTEPAEADDLEERERDVPRPRDEAMRSVLTRQVIASALRNPSTTMMQVAVRYKVPVSAVKRLCGEYGLSVKALRLEAASEAEQTAPPQEKQPTVGIGMAPAVHSAEQPAPAAQLPPGLAITADQQLRVTINDQGCTGNDVLSHLRTVEVALMAVAGRRLNVTLTVEEAAS